MDSLAPFLRVFTAESFFDGLGLVDKHAEKVPPCLCEMTLCDAIILHAERVDHVGCNGVEVFFA